MTATAEPQRTSTPLVSAIWRARRAASSLEIFMRSSFDLFRSPMVRVNCHELRRTESGAEYIAHLSRPLDADSPSPSAVVFLLGPLQVDARDARIPMRPRLNVLVVLHSILPSCGTIRRRCSRHPEPDRDQGPPCAEARAAPPPALRPAAPAAARRSRGGYRPRTA